MQVQKETLVLMLQKLIQEKGPMPNEMGERVKRALEQNDAVTFITLCTEHEKSDE